MRQRLTGFELIWLGVRALFTRLPWIWWSLYLAAGAIAALALPSAELLGRLGQWIASPGQSFWLSAAINSVALAVLLAFIRAGMEDDRLTARSQRSLTTEHFLVDDVPLRATE